MVNIKIVRQFIPFILLGPGSNYLIPLVATGCVLLLLVCFIIFLIVTIKMKYLITLDRSKYYNGIKTSNTLFLLIERGLRDYSQVYNNKYVNSIVKLLLILHI